MEDSLRACTLIKKSGMRLGVQFYPGCQVTQLINLFQCRDYTVLGADDVRIYPAVVLRETELERLYFAGKNTSHFHLRRLFCGLYRCMRSFTMLKLML
jgi:histone acetyltransferase (RNA polymerase elongator complex component)